MLFYAPPENAHFYSEILNLLEFDGLPAGQRGAAHDGSDAAHATVSALFCKYDLQVRRRSAGAAGRHPHVMGVEGSGF